METNNEGITRTVILTKRWAIKIPCLTRGWKFFLYGFLANMQEVAWSGAHEKLCPIRFSLPGGLMVVMPRCEPLTEEEFAAFIRPGWAWIDGNPATQLPVETQKISSFGKGARETGLSIRGRVVAVDYGGSGRDDRKFILTDRTEVLITRDKLYETVKCPGCGLDYEAIPRYALVGPDGKTPYLWSNNRVCTGSKEEIELLAESHNSLAPRLGCQALELDRAQWIVLFKRDAEPIEVTLTKDRAEAFGHYDKLAVSWSEVYLCQVIKGLPIEA